MASDQRISELRASIDAIDDEFVRLLNERAGLSIQVGEIKRAIEAEPQLYRPDREAQILRRLSALNPGPLPDEDLLRVMREIISSCLSLEQKLRIAYLGPEGTFTHAAVLKHFGGAVEPVPMTSIGDVFRDVEAHASDYGVVPVENSLEGSINQTLDCLGDSTLAICGEIVLAVHHQLLTREATLADVQRVYAHEQALAQCRGWLDRYLPNAERIALGSNAAAAQRAQSEPGAAAIAGTQAAERYALDVRAANIEDHPHNTTRFALLGHAVPPSTGDDVTSVMFSMPNKPGALHAILSVLADAGISMSRIESRPKRSGNWDYLFFVDLLGHRDDAGVAPALAEIESRAALFKVLGSCPRAVL
jgi:chorismate mutase / prephenate dehydratase